MILKLSDTKNKDFCVVFSHFFVEKGQEYKFDIFEYVVDYYNNLDAYIIFSAHGEVDIPAGLSDKIDAIYWEKNIDRSEIGCGHPKFCIEAFDMARKKGFENVLKMRAEDMLLNNDQFSFLLSSLNSKKMIISEQTNLTNKKVGDLFMFGQTEYIYRLWTANKWNYSRDGLYNLYNNFSNISENSIPNAYIKEKCLYLTPQDISWVTVTDAWNLKSKNVNVLESCYWGKKKGFVYYGGF